MQRRWLKSVFQACGKRAETSTEMANVSDPRMLLELLRQQIEGNLSASTPDAQMAKQDMSAADWGALLIPS